MSTPAATAPSASHPAPSSKPSTGAALAVGIAGLAVAGVGYFVSGAASFAMAWLVGFIYWISVALGVLFLVMIHHIFDAGWSVVLRRQLEHWLSSFRILFILFLPLLAFAWFRPDLLWHWMDPNFNLASIGGHGKVSGDLDLLKKSGFLNRNFFTALSLISILAWTGLAAVFRRNSFTQDKDGDPRWTLSSRKWAAAGIPFFALSLTACIIMWVKSLEPHWFSTMYGVWFFADCARVALCLGLILTIWLWCRGDYKGILNDNHLHSIGQLMLAFTVFWAYISFSQYFLIWNANVPEETFWYNIREYGDWWYVSLFLVFGNFLAPFLVLLLYPVKVNKKVFPWVGIFIAFVVLVDICYNALPSRLMSTGNPLPFFSLNLVWVVAAVIGMGGICAWSYLKSFSTTKLIPIRDPRIAECLTYHKPNAD